MALFGDQIRFKINDWQPISNRFTRDYDTEIKEYRSYNENKTVRLMLRGLKEKYSIELHDWSSSDIDFFKSLEKKTVKNLCTFQPSLDSDMTKLSYFEYYVDPFLKVLKIEITPVFLLQYSALPGALGYSISDQEFGTTIEKSTFKIGGVELPAKTSCKISVDYDTTEKISITGKIHREYKYQNDDVYKKIKFTGVSLDIDADLYNSLRIYQGGNDVEFQFFGYNYECAIVFDFVRYLKNKWLLNFNCEVQRETTTGPSLMWIGFTITPPVEPNNSLMWIGETITPAVEPNDSLMWIGETI